MDTLEPIKSTRVYRWLPYWAVLQADVQQTLRSWVFRAWVTMSVLAAVGYLLYRVGVYREAGIIQPASTLVSDLLRWTVLGSITLLVVLTVGSIASERGTLADSVLSRGISRYQYFLGKWHARLLTVLGSFLIMGTGWLVASHFLLHEDVVLDGALVAFLIVAALLAAVISLGVAVSAITSSVVLGITLLWMGLYGASFVLSLLPEHVPAPDRILQRLPFVLRGYYDLSTLATVTLWSAGISILAVLIGMFHFARRDV